MPGIIVAIEIGDDYVDTLSRHLAPIYALRVRLYVRVSVELKFYENTQKNNDRRVEYDSLDTHISHVTDMIGGG